MLSILKLKTRLSLFLTKKFSSGKCTFMEMPFVKLSIGELSVRGTVRWGNVFGELLVAEKYVGEMSVGELS